MVAQATVRENFGAGAGEAARWRAGSGWHGMVVLVQEQGGAASA